MFDLVVWEVEWIDLPKKFDKKVNKVQVSPPVWLDTLSRSITRPFLPSKIRKKIKITYTDLPAFLLVYWKVLPATCCFLLVYGFSTSTVTAAESHILRFLDHRLLNALSQYSLSHMYKLPVYVTASDGRGVRRTSA